MNAESCVLNNGFCTDYLMISRGVRQGCPISSYLFLHTAEVLAIKIRQDNRIKGIKIFRTEFKQSLFADDASAFLDVVNSLVSDHPWGTTKWSLTGDGRLWERSTK